MPASIYKSLVDVGTVINLAGSLAVLSDTVVISITWYETLLCRSRKAIVHTPLLSLFLYDGMLLNMSHNSLVLNPESPSGTLYFA